MTGQAESRIVRSRFSEEQIIAVLKESEAGVKTGELSAGGTDHAGGSLSVSVEE